MCEEHPDYPGELVFQLFVGEDEFCQRYRDWVSPWQVLKELHNLPAFLQILESDGYQVIMAASCRSVLEAHERWTQPLEIEGYDLYPFQQYGLRRGIEGDFFFFNWCTGAGKSFCSAAGAKKLIDDDLIDLVLVCTIGPFKVDMAKFFDAAGLDVVVNDGSKPKRTKGYEAGHRVYVANYEKLWADQEHLEALVAGRRVLFVLDEVQKILVGEGKKNMARRSLEQLRKLTAPGSKVWPMSASVVDGNPLRYRDTFSFVKPQPLGTKKSFESRYATVKTFWPAGYRAFPIVSYDWHLDRLQDVRHRVGGYTQAVRKTDAGLREQFKDMKTTIERITPSGGEQELYDEIVARARLAKRQGENLAPYYLLLRFAANTPEALMHSAYPEAQYFVDKFDLKSIPCTKMDLLNAQLASIHDEGSKVIVFTHWTNLSLKILAPKIEVPTILHFGAGQSARESQEAKERFRSDPNITCFFTSDAGKEGMSMQCARYVIQYEPTYSYDDSMQRASRIHRADSYLDGLTNYIYCIEGSIEERVLYINNLRRTINEAVQGTVEALSESDRELASRSEQQNQQWLVFG